jgi:methyl-accepting chemotaxis protein
VVQARRAKVRPVRVIVPLAVAAALLTGGSVAAWKFWPNTTTAGPQAQSSTVAVESQAPSTAESSPSPSETPSTDAASAAGAEALQACQAKVKAADEVRKQGKIGVLHWADHVDAQADYFDGELTSEELKARFKKTRVKGPGDLKRYNEALASYKELDGSCAKAEGADNAVAASLKKCSERSKAQRPVLEATAAGMKDWQAHIKQMQANAEHQAGSPSEAQAAWLKQYRTAPKNIKAFKKATKNFDAPSC